ncbi:MAG: globin [Rickettsiales bacterium]
MIKESLMSFHIDEAFVKRFYWRLIAISPEMKPIFSGSFESYVPKFKEAFTIFLNNIENIGDMKKSLNNLGLFSAGKNVKIEYMPTFKRAAIATLKDELGEMFTEDMRSVWERHLQKIIDHIKEGILEHRAFMEKLEKISINK